MAKLQYARASAANPLFRVFLPNSSSTTGAGLTGLSTTSTNLQITAIRELSASTTVYLAGSNLQTIATIGTYAAPSAGDIRFQAVDATNMPGVYEVQCAQSLFGTGDGSRFVTFYIFEITTTALNLAPTIVEIQLDAVDPQNATTFGLSALPAVAAGSASGLPLLNAAGNLATYSAGILSTALTESSTGYLAAAFKEFFNVASPVLTTASVNQSGDAYADLNTLIPHAFTYDGNNLPKVDVADILGTASAGAAGYMGVDWSAIHAPTTSVNLSGTLIGTAQQIASVSGAVGSVTGAVGSVTGAVGSVTGNVGGSVASVTGNVGGNVTGSVGSISGVTFPTHFNVLAIDGSGDVTFNNTTIGVSGTVNVGEIAGQTASAAGPVAFPSSIGTSTLTQAQVTGGSYALNTDGSGNVGLTATALAAVWTQATRTLTSVAGLTIGANLTEILGSALTGTAANIAAAWSKAWNIASSNWTSSDQPQTGDSYSIVDSGTFGNAAIKTQLGTLATASAVTAAQTDITAIEAVTNQLVFVDSNLKAVVEAYATGQAPDYLVWNALLATYDAANTFGEFVQNISGGGGGGGWNTNISTGFPSPQAGGTLWAVLQKVLSLNQLISSSSPTVPNGGTVYLTRTFDYVAANGQQFTIGPSAIPDLASTTVTLEIFPSGDTPGSLLATGTATEVSAGVYSFGFDISSSLMATWAQSKFQVQTKAVVRCVTASSTSQQGATVNIILVG